MKLAHTKISRLSQDCDKVVAGLWQSCLQWTMLEQPCDKVVYNQQGDDKFVTTLW